ncbi:hypothetical protein [Celeribacter indicus]|uniref:Uncharacterized protein n=1 Tax=Celeribacter indicus TaxID=1208324 RepID=A0A0B5DYG9_9RHOB|nr:hypothetical protein [Celeribacter indicus]AJE45771.1 hypothetical protein P73_1056 [Celeribacter indicus]SDX53033.1 hypothetical protein SAMN05443573_1382 [Celeribacter indicus]
MAIGTRIHGYRNSVPRNIKLFGASAGAQRLVADILYEGPPNLLCDRVATEGVRLDLPVAGQVPNAVIVVHVNGEPVVSALPVLRTASMLSLVVIEANIDVIVPPAPELRALQGVADLFVTTSDWDFVAELVGNLAS